MQEQLFINGVEVPLSRSINPSFTRAIADIKKPDKRRSTYSKSVIVPHSKEAANVFGGIFDINAITTAFDQPRKQILNIWLKVLKRYQGTANSKR